MLSPLFDLFVAGVFATAILMLIESVGMLTFWPWVYSLGPRVLRPRPLKARTVLPLGSRFSTPSAKFRIVDSSTCLFRHKFRVFHISTPFPIKGQIKISESSSTAEGRIPLGSLAFIGLWLAGWSYGTVAMLLYPAEVQNDTGIPPLVFGAIGFAAVGLIFFVSIPLELRRARRAIDEFTREMSAA